MAWAKDPASWWNSSFAFRTPITISNHSESLDDYQIALDMTEFDMNLTGLVGSWHFNDATGTKAKDSSGNENHGNLTNMVSEDWVSGVEGTAMEFDGVNDYLEAAHKERSKIKDN